jgi:hypothetical protein
VEVRDDEVRVRRCQLKGTTASITPVRPAQRNWNRNPQQKSIGVAKRTFPPKIVAIQLKILIPVGMLMSIVVAANAAFPVEFIPTENMWCAQTPMPIRPIATVAATIIG